MWPDTCSVHGPVSVEASSTQCSRPTRAVTLAYAAAIFGTTSAPKARRQARDVPIIVNTGIASPVKRVVHA